MSTNDPAAFVNGEGAIAAFGGYKGYGIAVFAELLGSLLPRRGEPSTNTNSMFSMYIRTDGTHAGFQAAAHAFTNEIRAAAPRTEDDTVTVPGDRARSRREEALRRGTISLSSALAETLRNASLEAGLRAEFLEGWRPSGSGQVQ